MYATPPRHELHDLQGEKRLPTGAKWHIEPREYGKQAIVFTPTHRLDKDQVSRLRWLYSVISDHEVEVKENGVVIVVVPVGERYGWVLGKVASFYRMAQNGGRFT